MRCTITLNCTTCTATDTERHDLQELITTLFELQQHLSTEEEVGHGAAWVGIGNSTPNLNLL
jgi:hypothetical protein